MNCESCKEQLAEYLLGELDATTRLEVDRALADCPECRVELSRLRRLFDTTAAAPRLDFDADRRDAVLAQAERAAVRLARRQDPPWYAHPSFLMAASALLAVGATVALLQLRDSSPETTAPRDSVALQDEYAAPAAPATPPNAAEEGRAVNEAGLHVQEELPLAAAAEDRRASVPGADGQLADAPGEPDARGPVTAQTEGRAQEQSPSPVGDAIRDSAVARPRASRSEAQTAAAPARGGGGATAGSFGRDEGAAGYGAVGSGRADRTGADSDEVQATATATGSAGLDALYGGAATAETRSATAPSPSPAPTAAQAPAPAGAAAAMPAPAPTRPTAPVAAPAVEEAAPVASRRSAVTDAPAPNQPAEPRQAFAELGAGDTEGGDALEGGAPTVWPDQARAAEPAAEPVAEREDSAPEAATLQTDTATASAYALDTGISLYRAARYSEAAALLEQLVSEIPLSDPRAALAQFHLGAALYELGEHRRARYVLERLLDRYPRSEHADLARDLLAAMDRAESLRTAPASEPARTNAP